MSKLSAFAKADVSSLVEQLTTDEAILLTAGVGFWHTHPVPRLGIPAIKVSDGPNGVRGNYFFMSTPAKCLPSATAMASTFDTELLEEVGEHLLAPEAKLRSASVVLGPTCNIQRSPLGGRSFESFSEDPHLNGMLAAAYIKGLQKGGIGACIKHFTCNDKENDRMGSDSILSDRALREIYLMPFMLSLKHGGDKGPWAFMTAYNRINGTHVSENPYLLRDILRKEWGFEGLVMSDWFGIYSIDHALNAGLDLEMPGTNKWRTLDLVNRSIGSRKVTLRTVKERARTVLELVQKCAQGAPEILDGDGSERTRESEGDKALMRRLAREAVVLLKNEGGLLPLKFEGGKTTRLAIVGGNAKARILGGGGSASLKPSYFVSPYDGLVRALEAEGKDVEVSYAEGARAYMQLPTLEDELVTASGERGWMGSWYAHESDESMVPKAEPFYEQLVDETRCFISVDAPKGLTKRWTLRLSGNLKARSDDVEWEFGLLSAGRAKLFIDGALLIDNWTRQTRGDAFFGSGSAEERGTVVVRAGHAPAVRVEFANVRAPADGDEDEAVMDSNPGVRLGAHVVCEKTKGGAEWRSKDDAALMEEAVAVAREADVVVCVVGLNADWETEGYDRTTLGLPGTTDELVRKVVEANPRTVVVTQSGSSITMPWADAVPALVHGWYLGNASGDALADVLLGKHNPSGKLSMSFPKRLEDVASHGHFMSEHGKIRYAEDLLVGYKHHHHRGISPAFAFGYGISYTTFSYTDLKLSTPTFSDADVSVTASVTITNTGALAGSEVVQLYVTLPAGRDMELTHVPLALKAFAKARDVQPGEGRSVEMKLDKYALSFWEERIGRWVVEKGEYVIRVGPSSESFPVEGRVKIEKRFEWKGL